MKTRVALLALTAAMVVGVIVYLTTVPEPEPPVEPAPARVTVPSIEPVAANAVDTRGPILPDGEWEAERVARRLRVNDPFVSERHPRPAPEELDALVAAGLAGDAEAAILITSLLHRCDSDAIEMSPDPEAERHICAQLSSTGHGDPVVWVERAVATGSLQAKRVYFFLQAGHRHRFTDDEWATVQLAGRHHLERARDAGDIDAFAIIAFYQAGLLDVSPYPVDYRAALAHAYAGAEARRALVAHRDASGFYEASGLRDFDVARARRLENLADEYATFIPSQVEDAKAIARMLLERCCQ